MTNKNKTSWNNGAAAYSALRHNDKVLNRIIEDPANAFHHTTWAMINKYVPDLRGKRICIPSSGDNHAVFAFAISKKCLQKRITTGRSSSLWAKN